MNKGVGEQVTEWVGGWVGEWLGDRALKPPFMLATAVIQ